MFEFEKSGNRTFTVDGRERTHTHYVIHADYVTDLSDDFVSKLRDVVSAIADEFASDGSFSFADCRDALRGVYKVHGGEFISSDWDEREFASELDELRGADRSKHAWLMTYSRRGYEDNKARSAFNERIIGGFLVDRCVHDELILRGYDDDTAWEKASGCSDKMWDSLTECGLADCAEYVFDDEVLAYALHADHLSDLDGEFESALRDVVNGIADKLADENGAFEFETCSQVLANIVHHCEEIVTIASYEDMDRLGAEFDALPFESPFEERNRYWRFLEFHVNGRCDDGTPSVEFNQWSLCEPFADQSIYDELVSRGMDAEDARWRANGLLRDMMGDTYLPRDGCQFDDYTPCEVFSSIVCAVNKLFPKGRAPQKE